MAPHRYQPDVEFARAPVGARVRFLTGFSFAVLRLPEGCLVVSSAQPDIFVEAARRRLATGV